MGRRIEKPDPNRGVQACKQGNGENTKAATQSRGVSSVSDGWRSSPAFRGFTLDRNGDPLAVPAVMLSDLDRNPYASGLALRPMMAKPSRATVPTAIADFWQLPA